MNFAIDVGERLEEIKRIRGGQDELYSDMNRFTVQTILTYMHNSPMSVDEVFAKQQQITEDITERQVTKILDELVEAGYAEKKGRSQYVHTEKSYEALNKAGITKDLFIP